MAEEMEGHLFGDGPPPSTGNYCDCTVGAGGYARRILHRAPGGRLVAMDRDSQALRLCRDRLRGFSGRISYFHGSFGSIGRAVRDHLPLTGIVADLGLSRLQFEDAGRGFSLRLAGPLDMRMDRRQDMRAEDWVNRGGERELADLLYRLADERHSRRIAKALVRARPLRDTVHLARVAAAAVPRRRHRRLHPATRTFLALRMAVNNEIGELKALLRQAPGLLAPGGRFVVVSFHSGEDRVVKHTFRRHARRGLYRLLTKRVARPSPGEVECNPSSRSARLRAVLRLATGTVSG